MDLISEINLSGFRQKVKAIARKKKVNEAQAIIEAVEANYQHLFENV